MDIIPFTNAKSRLKWYNANCKVCTTKCYHKANIDKCFETNTISARAAFFVGYTTDIRFTEIAANEKLSLNLVCQHKDKYVKTNNKKKTKC